MENLTLAFVNPHEGVYYRSPIAPKFRFIEMKEVEKRRYLVSEEGQIYDLHRGEFKKISINNAGYGQTRLGRRTFNVHRLVAAAFLADFTTDRSMVVDHIDGDRANNHVSNLRMISFGENVMRGKKSFNSKPTRVRIYDEETGQFICELGSLAEASRLLGYKTNAVQVYMHNQSSDEVVVRGHRVIREMKV